MSNPPFQPKPLPYARDALSPALSPHAIDLHYGRHHQAYADTVNRLLADDPLRSEPIETIIRESLDRGDAALFNAAAQLDNHDRFWASLQPAPTSPSGELALAINLAFGDQEGLMTAMRKAGMAHFASGWLWLVLRKEALVVESSPNAETPITSGGEPLLVIDLWEHAYYPNYENRRQAYLDSVIPLLDWESASQRFGATR